MPKLCSIADCGRKVDCRGWCVTHYGRWKKYGDPLRLSFGVAGPAVETTPDVYLRQRFENKLNKTLDGCWVWIGSIHGTRSAKRAPRGAIQIGRKRHSASRTSWLLYRGEIPGGQFVLHDCDNSLCVNPDHLYLGTQAQNMDDMAKRRRSWHLKLTEDQVRYARSNPKIPTRRLAREWGVDPSSVAAARKFQSHRHVV
jgi:hypothetical protein